MIRGFVDENDEPIISITLALGKGPKRFQAVLDTGFNGYLSVPQSIALRSNWYFAGYEEYEIATGEQIKERVYLGKVLFENRRLIIPIVTSRSQDLLVGTKLLSGRELHVDFSKRTVWIRKVLKR